MCVCGENWYQRWGLAVFFLRVSLSVGSKGHWGLVLQNLHMKSTLKLKALSDEAMNLISCLGKIRQYKHYWNTTLNQKTPIWLDLQSHTYIAQCGEKRELYPWEEDAIYWDRTTSVNSRKHLLESCAWLSHHTSTDTAGSRVGRELVWGRGERRRREHREGRWWRRGDMASFPAKQVNYPPSDTLEHGRDFSH